MVLLRGRAGNAHDVEVPLGVRVVLDVISGCEVVLRMRERCPSGDGVESPMDEDAQLGAGIPLRKGMPIERVDRGLVFLGSLGAAHGRCGNKGCGQRAQSKYSRCHSLLLGFEEIIAAELAAIAAWCRANREEAPAYCGSRNPAP